MPKKNLKDLKLERLYKLRDAVDTFLFKNKEAGEQFHPEYRKHKKSFKKLVSRSISFKNEMNKFFKGQLERSSLLIERNKIKAESKNEFFNMEHWETEDQQLAVKVEFFISEFFELGAISLGDEFNYPITINNSTPEGKFISKYSLDLAKGINETTRKRLRQQLKAGIDLGETTDKIADRVNKVIDNPKRATMIAQTESVRAYSEGRIALGKRIGAKGKKWMTTFKPCPICSSLDQQIVPLDKQFLSKFDGKHYNAPPAHPHCRCLVKLIIEDPDKNL